jgi:hypothetical protein
VNMQATGGDTHGQLEMRIFGLPLAMINRLTTIGPIMNQIRGQNTISVAVGNDGDALTTIFAGTIDRAWADFQAAPDVVLNISSLAALAAAVRPVAASSYKGSADVATIMKDLADHMGFAFENYGVTAKLSNPYFPGTAYAQMLQCARAANINATVDTNSLIIWPKNGVRGTDSPLVSPQTGMVGYPVFASDGMELTSIFLPGAKLGGSITVDSSLTAAVGPWYLFSVSHTLESLKPGGAWFTSMRCYRTKPT